MTCKLKNSVLSAVILLSITAAAFRVWIIDNYTIELNSSANIYYLDNNIFTNIFSIGVAVIIGLIFIISIFVYKEQKPLYAKNKNFITTNSAMIFSSFLSGFTILSVIIYVVYDIISKKDAEVYEIIIIIMSLLSTAYFMIFAGKNNSEPRPNNDYLAILSTAPIFFIGVRMLFDFIRQSTAPTASSGSYHLLSLIAFLIFFLSESKMLVDKGNMFMYVLFGFLTVFLSCCYSLPAIILSGFGLLPLDRYVIYSAVDVSFIIFVITKLYTLNGKNQNKEIPVE